MNPFSRVVAILLVLVFIVALPLSILAYDVGRVVFNPWSKNSDLFTCVRRAVRNQNFASFKTGTRPHCPHL